MMEAEPSMTAPALSLRKEDLVTLLVGPKEEEFAVHESCITRNSDFFKAALKKEWIEGQTRIIKLPEETCTKNFVHYLNYAYNEGLPTEGIKTATDEIFDGNPYDTLGKMYVIGERMLDKSVQKAVAGEIIRISSLVSPNGTRHSPGTPCITLIYDGTSTGSPMRRVLVDIWATRGNVDWPCKRQHQEFLGELVEELQTKIMAQKVVCDFRFRPMAVEDYFP
jgi:hypothetical protein